jgi:hypothetical protein
VLKGLQSPKQIHRIIGIRNKSNMGCRMKKHASWCIVALLTIAFFANQAEAQVPPGVIRASPPPAAGTLEYYQSKVAGKYYVEKGALKKATILNKPEVLQVIDDNRISILMSGTSAALVSMDSTKSLKGGQTLESLAVAPDREYEYRTESDDVGSMKGFRVIETVTFDEYKSLYDAEQMRKHQEKQAKEASKKVALEEMRKMKIVSVETLRAPDSPRLLSYTERLRRRRAIEAERLKALKKPAQLSGVELQAHLRLMQMDAIRTGKAPLPIPLTQEKAPLPIPLSQEMDDQLVQDGVLPPIE